MELLFYKKKIISYTKENKNNLYCYKKKYFSKNY